MRNNRFLEKRAEFIWRHYFPDVNRSKVIVRFGRRAKTRLGSIKSAGKINPNTYITITGYFQDRRVPLYLIDTTLAHEIIHYAQGFFSSYPKLFRYPHQGGVVTTELQKHGLEDKLKRSKVWLKKNWRKIVYGRELYF